MYEDVSRFAAVDAVRERVGVAFASRQLELTLEMTAVLRRRLALASSRIDPSGVGS
jgi:hypothetical protein